MGTVFEEMSSWATLTIHIGVIAENTYLKTYSNKELIELGLSANPMLVGNMFLKIKIHHNKNPNILALIIFGLKCCLYP